MFSVTGLVISNPIDFIKILPIFCSLQMNEIRKLVILNNFSLIPVIKP